MISLLLQAKVTEDDLRNKDVGELVDCIISQFGGLKAVQTELRRKSRIFSEGCYKIMVISLY